MTAHDPRNCFSLLLALLLFLPAVPVDAGGSSAGDGGFDLRLEQALAFSGGSAFELDETFDDLAIRSSSGDSEAVSPLASGGLASLAAMSQSPPSESGVNQAAEEKRVSDQTRGKRGIGRWLKKYWYVPVLAAGAAVALADDDSDDPNEIDD